MFDNLTAQSNSYEPRANGEYHLASNTFADPSNYIRLRPGSVRKDGAMTIGATRVIEKDVVVGSDTVRKNGTISVNVVIPRDGSFTAAEIDSMLLDLSEVLTPTHIDQILQGKA